jgi:hypothetical protein
VVHPDSDNFSLGDEDLPLRGSAGSPNGGGGGAGRGSAMTFTFSWSRAMGSQWSLPPRRRVILGVELRGGPGGPRPTLSFQKMLKLSIVAALQHAL